MIKEPEKEGEEGESGWNPIFAVDLARVEKIGGKEGKERKKEKKKERGSEPRRVGPRFLFLARGGGPLSN